MISSFFGYTGLLFENVKVLSDIGKWKLEFEVILHDCQHVQFKLQGYLVKLIFYLIELEPYHGLVTISLAGKRRLHMHILLIVVNLRFVVENFLRDIVCDSCSHIAVELRKWDLSSIEAENVNSHAKALCFALNHVDIQSSYKGDALLLSLTLGLERHSNLDCVDTGSKELFCSQKFHLVFLSLLIL